MFQRIFIEYNNFYPVKDEIKDNRILKESKLIKDGKKRQKILEYVKERRNLLNRHGYEEYPLVVLAPQLIA